MMQESGIRRQGSAGLAVAVCALLLIGCGESTPMVEVHTSVPQDGAPAQGTRVSLIEPSTALADIVYLRNRAEAAANAFVDAWGYQSVRQWAPSVTYAEDPRPYESLAPMVRGALRSAGYVMDDNDPQMRVRADYYFRKYEYIDPPDVAVIDTGGKRRWTRALPWQGGKDIQSAEPHRASDGTPDGGERVTTFVHAISLTFIPTGNGEPYRAAAGKVDPAREITAVAPQLIEQIIAAIREAQP
jgi:hypothetical protein